MGQVGSLRVRFDAFELNESDARLTRSGKPVSLPPKAFGVLCALARHPGQLMTKSALLDAVWGHQHVSESVLKTTISELRSALADDAKQPRYIETASRFGYRFIGTMAAPAATAVPMPVPVAPAVTDPSIVGREASLAKLRGHWQRAQAGERQLVWIAGEAGVGKTTLIESFSNELGPGVAAYGRCIEHFGSGEPYLPLLEALRELCRRDPALTEAMRTTAPTWLIQMPWLVSEADRAVLQREVAGAHQDRMVREMRELMDRYTETRPLLFVLEDLHWSDLGTLRMMEHFARRPRQVRLMWIASFRLTQVIAENHPLRELRQELRAHRLCEEILLDPFSEQEVGAYLQSRVPEATIPEDFARRLHAHTDGLPLFIANVTDALIAQGAFESSAQSGRVALPVPESLAGVIENQIRRLPADMQSVLEAASVLGMEFSTCAVAKMLDREPSWVTDRCDALVRDQVWLRHCSIVELPDGGLDSRYTFLHSLYQHVFYDRIAISQRVQHHRRAAKVLDSPAPAELASHFERGHETMNALRAYAEVAQNALAHFAPRDAESLCAHALSLLKRCPASDDRLEMEFLLTGHAGVAASLLHGAGSEQARVLAERVHELCDRLPQTPARAAALNGLGWVHYTRGEYAQAIDIANRLLDIAARHDDSGLYVFGCNLLGVTLVVRGQLVEACDWLEKGIARCLELGERMPLSLFVIDPEVSMRMNISIPLVDRGFAAQACEHVARAIARAESIVQPISRVLGYWSGGMLEVRLGQPEKVAGHAARLAKVVESSMILQGEGPSLWLRGWAEAQRGDARGGLALIREGLASHEKLGMYAGCTEVLGYAAEALILAGDWDGAERQIDEAFRLGERIGERYAIPTLHALRARAAQGRKDLHAAREHLKASAREARAQQAHGLELKALTALASLPGATPADREACQRLRERLGLQS